jgi:cellulose synthase/poly-beta-1,6-N-acetylglucosamine synthase-like glycosyltransferase
VAPYYLVYLYMKNKDRHPAPAGMERLPKVTVQLPIYNEMYVADRLIDAVCQLCYPRELLEDSRCWTTRPTKRRLWLSAR